MDNTLEAFVNTLQENSNADSLVTLDGNTILLVKRVEESIKSQVKEPGSGSIFSKAWKLDELKHSLSKIKIKNSGLYEGKLPGAGFNLIIERKDVVPFKKLVGFTEDKILDEDVTKRVASIPKHIDKFKTDVVTYSFRSISLDEAIKDFTEFEKEALNKTLFILEDVEIGQHINKWDNDFYIVIPKK